MIIELGKTLMAEIAESAITTFGNVSAFPLTPREREVEKQLATDGVVILRGFYQPSDVARLRDEVETLIAKRGDKIWLDAQKSDHRYFGANHDSRLIRRYLLDEFIQRLGQSYTRSEMRGRLTLAAKLIYRDGNLGSGGGWHRDSPVRRQFKSLLYLSDVNETNGPFEYLVGTHRKESVVKLVSHGLQSYKQYRFSDEEIDTLLAQSGVKRFTFTGQAGDMALVDTKGIHRGAPMRAGVRYALTNYFWSKRIPPHMAAMIK